MTLNWLCPHPFFEIHSIRDGLNFSASLKCFIIRWQKFIAEMQGNPQGSRAWGEPAARMQYCVGKCWGYSDLDSLGWGRAPGKVLFAPWAALKACMWEAWNPGSRGRAQHGWMCSEFWDRELFLLKKLVFLCVRAGMSAPCCACVEVSGQLYEVAALLPPLHRSRGLNSGCQSLWQLTFYITCTGWALGAMMAHACNPRTWEAGAK